MKDPLWVIDPSGNNVEAARTMARQVADLVIDHFATLRRRPVFCPETAGSSPAGEDAEGGATAVGSPAPGGSGGATDAWGVVLGELRRVVEGSMQVAHPRFFGHMDSGPLYVSVLADWVVSALNQNLLSWELSPVASAVEEEVVRWWCRLCGWDGGEGVPVSGGTAANGTALLMALDRVTEGRFRRKGVWALRGQPAVFASDQAHVSIRKAAVAAGLGEESVVPVPSDGRFRLDVDALDQAVRRALTAGRAPVMAVATAGTTSTGSVDPIGDAAKVCRRYGLWLHVDAAHGGAALLSSRARVKLSGIEEADSVTVDPHKWLMQPKGLGLVLTRHVGVLGRLFGSDAPYLARSGHPQGRGGLTFQGSRRFDALRLWMTRLYLGDEGLGQLVERGLALAQAWDRMLRGEKAFESACPPDLNLVCFRYRSGASPEETDRLNERIQRELLYGGSGFVSITTLRGRRWLRSVFINPTTTEEDQAAVLRALEALAKRGTDAQGA